MEKEQVVPDVIDKIPDEVVEVNYPSGVQVNLGNELTPTQVKDEPTVKWSADEKTLYTVVMFDPDVPDKTDRSLGAVLHWLVGNVPGKNIKNGNTIAEYVGSGPRLDTGLHRYVFLIYAQNGKIEFNESIMDRRTTEGRFNFSVRKFAEKYNLSQPVAGNFYQAQYDDWVPVLHSAFKK